MWIAKRFLKYNLEALPDHILKEILKSHHWNTLIVVSESVHIRWGDQGRIVESPEKIDTYILEFSIRKKRYFKSKKENMDFSIIGVKITGKK